MDRALALNYSASKWQDCWPKASLLLSQRAEGKRKGGEEGRGEEGRGEERGKEGPLPSEILA